MTSSSQAPPASSTKARALYLVGAMLLVAGLAFTLGRSWLVLEVRNDRPRTLWVLSGEASARAKELRESETKLHTEQTEPTRASLGWLAPEKVIARYSSRGAPPELSRPRIVNWFGFTLATLPEVKPQAPEPGSERVRLSWDVPQGRIIAVQLASGLTFSLLGLLAWRRLLDWRLSLPSARSDTTYTSRVPELDGVRGVAILLILFWHLGMNRGLDDWFYQRWGIVGEWLTRLGNWTWCGVDLFFVLSGYLICCILLVNRSATNYFRIFYLRRACRILPLYLLMLAVLVLAVTKGPFCGTVLQACFYDTQALWSYFVFAQNIMMGLANKLSGEWLKITWSLAVEEQFYLVLPVLVWLLPRRALVITLAALAVLAPAWRAWLGGWAAYVNLPCRADALCAGALLACFATWPPSKAWLQRHAKRLTQLALLSIVLGLLAGPWIRGGPGGVLAHVWLALFFSLILLSLILPGDSPLHRALRHPVLRWFGLRSYGIYLLHPPLSLLCFLTLSGSLGMVGAMLVALAGTLLLAELSWHLLELPFVVWGHQHRYDRR